MADDNRYDDFLNALDDNRHDAFLNAPATKAETKGHTFKQYNPNESVLGRLFGKYAPDVVDWAGGATSTARGGLNLVSPGLGEKTFPITGGGLPYDVNKESLPYISGQITDPYAATIGFGAGKVVQAVPAVTNAYKAANATRTAGTAAKNVPLTAETVLRSGVGGAAGGAGTGYLASEGDTNSTTMGGLFGGALGATFPIAGKAIQGTAGWLTDLVKNRLGQVKAGQIAREAAGTNLPAIRSAMGNAPADLTAGQAALGINQDPWQALAATAAKNDPASFYRQLLERQASQREGMLSGVTPDLGIAEANRSGASAQAYPAAFATDRARQAAVTVGPVRPEFVVTNPSTGGGYFKPPIPLTPQLPPSIQALSSEPIMLSAAREAADVIRIDPKIPDALRTTLTDNPMGSAQGLHAMKLAIEAQLKNPNQQSALAKYSQSSLQTIRTQLVKALGEVSPEYSAAREQFARLSEPVNQANVLEQLRQRLVNPLNPGQQRAGVFTSALDRGQESALKAAGLDTRFTGTIQEALTPQQFQTVNQIADALTNQQALATQAKAGAGALEQITGEALGRQMKLPGYMAAPVTVTNKLLELLTGKVNRQTIEAISKGMQSGRTAAEMLDTLPTSERNRALLALGQADTIAPTVAGTFGAAQKYPKKEQ